MVIKNGEKVYIEWMGVREVEVIKYLPNSHRYKVLQDGTWERMIDESKVYPTYKSVLAIQLDYVKKQIDYYTKEKKKLEQELGETN